MSGGAGQGQLDNSLDNYGSGQGVSGGDLGAAGTGAGAAGVAGVGAGTYGSGDDSVSGAYEGGETRDAYTGQSELAPC